jgi:hypothetical protein
VTLVRTDVSEKLIASIIKVIRIGELRTTLAGISNRSMMRRNNLPYQSGSIAINANVVSSSPNLFTLRMEAMRSSEMTVLKRATRRHIPEDCIPPI